MSIKIKFILLFILVTLVPAIYATISNSNRSLDRIVEGQKEIVSLVADLNKDQINAVLYDVSSSIQFAADNYPNIFKAFSSLESYQDIIPNVVGVALIEGDSVVQTLGYFNTEKRIQAQSELSEGVVLSHFATDRLGRVLLEFSYRENAEDSRYVSFQVQSSLIESLFLDYTGRGRTGETYFVTKNKAGDYITISPLRFLSSAAHSVGINARDSSRPDYYLFNAEAPRESIFDYRGNEVLFEVRKLAMADWGLVSKVDREEVTSATSGLLYKNTINVLIVYALVVIAAFFVVGYFVNPIKKILRVVQQASANNFNAEIDIERDDEIGDLSKYVNALIKTFAKGYNSLSKELKEKTSYLESRNAELEETKKATLSILDDLNEQRDELVVSEARDEAIIEGISDGMLILDNNNVITFANDEALAMLSTGDKKDKLVGKKWVEDFDVLYTEGGVQINTKEYQKISKEGRYSILIGKTKKESIPIDVSESVMKSDTNSIGRIILFRDISDIRKTEKEMKRFQLAVKQVDEHIIITNSEGVIIYANPAVEKITGYSIDEVIGKTPALWGGQMPKEFYDKMWNTIKVQKKEFVGKLKNKRKDGVVYDAEARITPVLNDNGDIDFFMGMERDISQEEAVNRAKTEFVSLASHQLRTPLTAINWYLELLSDGSAGQFKKEQKEYIKEISEASVRMTRLVNDLLNISRIETGRLTVTPEEIDLDKFLEGIIKEVVPLTKDKKCQIEYVPKQKNQKVITDSLLSRQVVHNFLTNAIKYSAQNETCSVVVGLSKEKDEFVVSISDSGMGIPKEEHEKVFSKFFRSSNARLSDTDGTGLGLYTSKMIAETVGGRVWFESTLGKGSVFYFAMPAEGISAHEGEVSLSVIK